MATESIHVCSICGLEKQCLVRSTERNQKSIYVCVEKVKKQKMPCDGWIPKLAFRKN